ncbi:hypothetical protein AXG93_4202s1060 [Marchantia polymorpha subsp. ruderalis]|uniref:Uncharacterized protein n=1 Tax=Marchantia polymorpha subsp. ruderalis TaxID=1480154 RepID=A0A176WGT7_MARPO|nr:hypothetical protein AXG93_4202s1060 [Marchantia polymorpha subsp. ruderalis]
MELGVLGDGSGVAAREGPASARLLTAPAEMASGICGASVGGYYNSLGSHFASPLLHVAAWPRGYMQERRREGRLITFLFPDKFLLVDGVSDSRVEDTISLAVADESGKACDGCRVRRQANNEQARPKQKACKLILTMGSSADTGQAAITRNSPSSEEDAATNPELMVLDQKYRQLEERYNFLQDQCALSRKLQKAALKLQDEMVINARCEIDELHAKVQTELSAEQVQSRTLADELVRKTQALEQSEAARRADKELLGRLQSQCDELRTQRAAAELRLVEVEGHNRRATDRTREELVSRVDRCLRGYARWEIAAREKMTLRELEMRPISLMAGNGRSRRRVAERLESFLSKSRDAIANLW